jgi:hypothetical protein
MILSQKGNKPWGDNYTFFAFIFWGEGVDKSVSAFINGSKKHQIFSLVSL